tara:strand:+ start:761 stop:1081 length:321 start_codon:yes stop_codon:yes gene_type:complete
MAEFRDSDGNLKEVNKAEFGLMAATMLCLHLVLCVIIKVFDVCSLVLVALACFGVLSAAYLFSVGNSGLRVWGFGLVSVVVLWLYYFVRPKYKKSWRYKRFERRWL